MNQILSKSTSVLIFAFVLCYSIISEAQMYKSDAPLAHTYSIVARDSKTGEMGVGVQSHWFSVGTLVSWGKSGVGVVATQSFVNPGFGPDGLAMMESGISAEQALRDLVEKDEGRDYRQVAFLDVNGSVDAYTGAKCIESAGHHVGENYSIQANLMLNDEVVPAMAEAFESNSHLPLAERIVESMKAGEAAGGDIRGKQSAAILVVSGEKVTEVWKDKSVDLRVDDSTTPLEEIQRLLKVHRAYEHMNAGDVAVEHQDMPKALQEYGAAEAMFPDNLEMKYWKAIAMANNGLLNEAIPILREVYKKDPNWRTLTKRLPNSELLNLPKKQMKKLNKL